MFNEAYAHKDLHRQNSLNIKHYPFSTEQREVLKRLSAVHNAEWRMFNEAYAHKALHRQNSLNIKHYPFSTEQREVFFVPLQCETN
jgi:hypothetical protein